MEYITIAGIKVPKVNPNRSPDIFPSDFIETPTSRKNLQNILYPILEGYPTLLVGDAGVGKNAILYYINYLRNQPTIRFSFNEDTLPEDLIGSYRLLMSGNGFEWVNGPIIRALQMGGSFVADEMNLTSPAVIKRFSTVYESRYIDLLEGDGSRLLAEKNFHFVATQNPTEGFEGRKALPFDITRHFATVYIDEYPPDEILYILKKLYPDLAESVIQAAIRITVESERRVSKSELGKGDLEKYHFNLRNLKRVCKRLNEFDPTHKEVLFRELEYIFVEPFRKLEDRKAQKELIYKELGEKAEVLLPEVKFYVKEKSLFCNDKQIPIASETKATEILASLPMIKPIKEFAEKVLTAVQMKENILIEYAEEHDTGFLSHLITELSGNDIVTINLSKGIHTSDILGALKPVNQSKIEWIDGPLTRGIRNDSTIVIKGLEAAGAELIEKLNMLLDDARSITLPPESGEIAPISLKENSVIFAWKLHRRTKSTPTISRAFRNRFTAVQFPDLEQKSYLDDILRFFLPESELTSLMTEFHIKIKELSHRRVIGSANINPYSFGLSNLLRWKDHILHNNSESKEVMAKAIYMGGMIYYVNQISDPKERDKMAKILDSLIVSRKFPDDLYEQIEQKKKTYTISTDLDKKMWWDPELHKRDPNTGKARFKNSGNPLKQGVEINTPETGGQVKEGPDAWYGQETRGNQGQGEPAGGGGAWGYRTEELYKQFLAKRKILWSYSMGVTLEEYKDVFGQQLDEVELNLEKLFDPEIDIIRMYKDEGRRIDTRKYISFKNGKGDTKVFDKTIIDKKEEKLKGVEVVFLVSKARRIFNFEYSVVNLSALITSSHILNTHNVRFAVYFYSDLNNVKDKIDLVQVKSFEEEYTPEKENELFDSICKAWHGDSIYEYILLENCERYFTSESTTRIIVMISDFRGQRGKVHIEDELYSMETRRLKEEVTKNTNKSYIFLGVGLGNRNIAEHIFHDSIHINGDNFSSMPNLIGTELSKLILTHHIGG